MYNSFARVECPVGRKRLQCNRCSRTTIHTLEARCTGQWEEVDYHGHSNGGSDYSLYRCGACDMVCFEVSRWDSNVFDHEPDGSTYLPREEVQYPPASSSSFTFNTDYVPNELTDTLEEMLYAVAGGKLRLATVGLRMVVEYIVNHNGCDGRTLINKIDDLMRKGHVDEAQKNLLQIIREKGNAGAHTGKGMTHTEMVAGMGIIDLLLEKLYNGPGRHADAIAKANRAFGG